MSNTTSISNDTPEGQRTLSNFVYQHVNCCVSILISDLCNAGLCDESCSFGEMHSGILSSDDWEEPALDHIQSMTDEEIREYVEDHDYQNVDYTATIKNLAANDYQDFCDDFSVDPYQREALEHWVVSDWLANRLAAYGEMVDKDVHGLTVWGRACSGQAIHLDGVIARIYNDLHN